MGWKAALNYWVRWKGVDVRTGILEKDADKRILPTEGNPSPTGTLGQKTFSHEFGSRKMGIPQRGFIRKGFAGARRRALKRVDDHLRESGIASSPHTSVLMEVGDMLVASMKDVIDHKTDPPLQQQTIDNKGHAFLLKDTRQMYNAISYEIKLL